MPELFGSLVNVQIDFVENSSQVHGLFDDVEIFRAVVGIGVDGSGEQHPVVDLISGEVEELGADDHEGFTPLSFDFVGLSEKRATFFWWMTGNNSVVVRIRSTSR